MTTRHYIFDVVHISFSTKSSKQLTVRAVAAVGLSLSVQPLDESSETRAQFVVNISDCVTDEDRKQFKNAWHAMKKFAVVTESGDVLEPE